MDKTMCISADKRLQEFLESVPEDHSHRRMVQQEVKCGFGLDGVCCRLCSNGPCRISKARPKGVCGADRDTIAARNFLRSVAAGSGCYIHVMEQAAKELKSAALAGRKLKGVDALHRLCDELGIGEADDSQMALRLSEAVLEDLRRPYEEPMHLTEKLAYAKRTGVWKNAGLLPGGAKDEIFNAIVKTSTNLNSDPMDMLTQCLRLGISTGIYGLVLVNRLNDILMGEPELGFDPVGMRVIDPECINIMVTGHQHSMFGSLTGMMEHPEIKEMADRAGARGIRIVVISRDVTWTLQQPEETLLEWKRVAKPGGQILYFDANWYYHLFDEEWMKLHLENEKIKSQNGLPIHDKGKVMEEIARELPMSKRLRPTWDLDELPQLGFRNVKALKNLNSVIYTEEEQLKYRSKPEFLVIAEK